MKKYMIMHSKGGVGKSTFAIVLHDIFKSECKKVALVDLDPQATMSHAIKIGRDIDVVDLDYQSNADVMIIDTPPYRTTKLQALSESVDKIFILISAGVPDLMTCKSLVDVLTKKKLESKVTVIFNRVRLPLNSGYKDVVSALRSTMPQIGVAKNIIADRLAYSRIWGSELKGKAFFEAKKLAKELGII